VQVGFLNLPYLNSGEGIQLRQLVVEAVTKKPVKDLMRERFRRRSCFLQQDV
jgi:hypothetical protein